jgi:ubiquinone/menaquinone biosynthesis C-methylase UbiE
MFIASLKFYRQLSMVRSRRIAAAVADFFPTNGQVLDFGCGNFWTSESLCSLKPGMVITGIDVVRDQNLQVTEGSALRFQLYDGKRIPFDDSHFDYVIATSVLHHTPHPEYFLDEFIRVVKPEGRIVIVEEMYTSLFNRIWISWQDFALNKLKKGIPVPLQFRSYQHYNEQFEKRGLRIVAESSVRPGFPWQLHRIFCLSHSPS